MSRYLSDPDFLLNVGDALDELAQMEDGSVDCVITSPPYWGLRDYRTGEWSGGDGSECDHGPDPEWVHRRYLQSSNLSAAVGEKSATQADAAHAEWRKLHPASCPRCGATLADRQLGMEATPEEYVTRMVDVFREVRRVLAPHGTCWLNLGDSYNGSSGSGGPSAKQTTNVGSFHEGGVRLAPALKPKDLVGIPWRVAFALQADGWYLRSDVIWAKPNPMPESITDRPTKAHEYVFMLSKRGRYYFDQEAVREQYRVPDWMEHPRTTPGNPDRNDGGSVTARPPRGLTGGAYSPPGQAPHGNARGPDGRKVTQVVGKDGSVQHRDGERWPSGGRNVRSVWWVATRPYAEAHFATYPPELVRRCLLAGCPEQVCRTCGKPRTRLVESDGTYEERKALGYGKAQTMVPGVHPGGHRGVHAPGLTHDLTPTERNVIGWSDCGHDDYRRGVVLDPFMGSGTTAYVARAHGRNSIGIELSPEFAALAAARLQQLSLIPEGLTIEEDPPPLMVDEALSLLDYEGGDI